VNELASLQAAASRTVAHAPRAERVERITASPEGRSGSFGGSTGVARFASPKKSGSLGALRHRLSSILPLSRPLGDGDLADV
jgi:hypothetical protein